MIAWTQAMGASAAIMLKNASPASAFGAVSGWHETQGRFRQVMPFLISRSAGSGKGRDPERKDNLVDRSTDRDQQSGHHACPGSGMILWWVMYSCWDGPIIGRAPQSAGQLNFGLDGGGGLS